MSITKPIITLLDKTPEPSYIHYTDGTKKRVMVDKYYNVSFRYLSNKKSQSRPMAILKNTYYNPIAPNLPDPWLSPDDILNIYRKHYHWFEKETDYSI